MTHTHWVAFVYHDLCPPCRVRRLAYGYRMDPVGQHEFWYGTMNDARLTVAQRLWIAGRVKPVAVGDE